MNRERGRVRHVVRHLPHPVHVVGEDEQPGGDLAFRQHLEGLAHHGRARDLAEGADMRQAGRAIARLEQRLALARFRQTRLKLAGFLEGPGLGQAGRLDEGGIVAGHGWALRSGKAGFMAKPRQAVNAADEDPSSRPRAGIARVRHAPGGLGQRSAPIPAQGGMTAWGVGRQYALGTSPVIPAGRWANSAAPEWNAEISRVNPPFTLIRAWSRRRVA